MALALQPRQNNRHGVETQIPHYGRVRLVWYGIGAGVAVLPYLAGFWRIENPILLMLSIRAPFMHFIATSHGAY